MNHPLRRYYDWIYRDRPRASGQRWLAVLPFVAAWLPFAIALTAMRLTDSRPSWARDIAMALFWAGAVIAAAWAIYLWTRLARHLIGRDDRR